MPPELKRT